MLKSVEIFQEFQKKAIEWGKQFQIAHVGDIVEIPTKKGSQKVMITDVSVAIGRNAQMTTKKSFYLDYSGRRMKKDGTFKDSLGTGICLRQFKTKSGKEYKFSDFGITEIMNDAGLSFTIEHDIETVKLYPNCEYNNYLKFDYPYPF